MTRFGHKLNYVINTFVKHTPALSSQSEVITMLNRTEKKNKKKHMRTKDMVTNMPHETPSSKKYNASQIKNNTRTTALKWEA